MANDEDYEILPHQLLNDLKGEVEALKKKLTQPDSKINELILEIESMKDSLHELNSVFVQALKEMKEEDVTKTVKDLGEKLTDVISQNETIAKGMLAISDKVDDFIAKQQTAAPESTITVSAPSSTVTVRHDMGMPQMEGPSRTAPMPSMDLGFPAFGSPEPEVNSFPPPPPSMGSAPKRKGLFR
jgi:seryl-tRNA synthetase